METCSNCGAPVRPGAKFCTGCGNRLNDVDTSGSGPSGWNETAPVEDAPPAGEPTVGRVVSTRVVSDGDTVPVSEPTVVANEQPATTWTWGSLETDDPAARVPVTPADNSGQGSPASVAGEHPASEREPEPAPAPFNWSWETPSHGEPAAEATATEGDSHPIAEPMVDSSTENVFSYRPSHAPTVESRVTTEAVSTDDADTVTPPDVTEQVEPVSNHEADATGEDQADRAAREAEIADAPPPYDWRQSVTYGYEERSVPAAGAVSQSAVNNEATAPTVLADSDSYGDGSAQVGAAGPIDESSAIARPESSDPSEVETRVLALLDELRSLVPALGAESRTGVQSEVDSGTSDAAALALQVLDEATASAGDSGDLRSVLEAARTRPRDMDAVLDLVGRAGNLIDLLDERDRLVAAVDRAASTLRESS